MDTLPAALVYLPIMAGHPGIAGRLLYRAHGRYNNRDMRTDRVNILIGGNAGE